MKKNLCLFMILKKLLVQLKLNKQIEIQPDKTIKKRVNLPAVL